MPRLVIYNPLLAYETGEEFMRSFRALPRASSIRSCSVLEGSVPNEQISGEGHWATTVSTRRAASRSDAHLDRPSRPRAAAVLALGTCAAYGGIPAMRGNPTGAMGLRDYLGWDWTSRRGLPIVNLPGCPVQPDNITETLLHLALHVAGSEPDDRPRRSGPSAPAVRANGPEGCGRAGFAEQGEFAHTPADHRGCLVKLGCKGPVAKCNVPCAAG